MKVVINACYGGFSLSRAGFDWLRARGNAATLAEPDVGEYWSDGSGPRKANPGLMAEMWHLDIKRNDPDLVALVETLGEKASGACAELVIVEIPDDVEWEVSEYDGYEHVAESHRTWHAE